MGRALVATDTSFAGTMALLDRPNGHEAAGAGQWADLRPLWCRRGERQGGLLPAYGGCPVPTRLLAGAPLAEIVRVVQEVALRGVPLYGGRLHVTGRQARVAASVNPAKARCEV
jgi:hypothetical protein